MSRDRSRDIPFDLTLFCRLFYTILVGDLHYKTGGTESDIN